MFLSSRKIVGAALLVLLSMQTMAQEAKKTLCHVYVVDVVKARRAFDRVSQTNNESAYEKASSAGQTIFPEFSPTIGEEELTTKHYSFPGSKLIITASVFYTDESMLSHGYAEYPSNSNSMLVGVTVSRRPQRDAVLPPTTNTATAEVTDDIYTNKIRAKQYVRVGGRNYLVGIECDCMANRRGK